jgi:hypothetical protein
MMKELFDLKQLQQTKSENVRTFFEKMSKSENVRSCGENS